MQLIIKINGRYRSLNRVVKATLVLAGIVAVTLITNWAIDAEWDFNQARIAEFLAR